MTLFNYIISTTLMFLVISILASYRLKGTEYEDTAVTVVGGCVMATLIEIMILIMLKYYWLFTE